MLQESADSSDANSLDSGPEDSCCHGADLDFLVNHQAGLRPATAESIGPTTCRISLGGEEGVAHDRILAWLETVAFSDQLDPFRDDWAHW